MTGLAVLPLAALSGYFALGILGLPWRGVSGLAASLPAAFGLGSAAFLLLFLLAGAAGPVPLAAFHLLAAALGTVWLFRRKRTTSPDPPAERGSSDRRDLLLAAAPAALTLALVALTLPLPLFDWEARIHWALKARFLAADPTLAGAAFRDPYLLHVHPRYPLLVPFLSSLMARHQGEFLESHYQLLVGAFSLLAVWQLHLLLRRVADRVVAAALASVMALTGAFAVAQFGARVEVALTFFLLLAVDRLFLWMERRRTADLLLAAAFLFGGAMTKNEGMLLSLCAVLAFVPAAAQPDGARAALRAAGFVAGTFALLSAAWFAQLPAIPPVSDEHYLARLASGEFVRGLARLPQIARAVFARVTDLSRWHLLWITPVASAAAHFIPGRKAGPALRMTAILASLYFAGLLAVYVISPWRDIALHIESTFDRVALPLLPLLLLATALAFGDGNGTPGPPRPR